MLRSLCIRQCLSTSRLIRCHSTTVLKSHLAPTFKLKLNNNIAFERFRGIRRCFASTTDTNLTKKNSEAGQDGKVQVYKGILSTQIKLVKVFSLATSITGIFMQPILYKQSNIIGGLPVVSDGNWWRWSDFELWLPFRWSQWWALLGFSHLSPQSCCIWSVRNTWSPWSMMRPEMNTVLLRTLSSWERRL